MLPLPLGEGWGEGESPLDPAVLARLRADYGDEFFAETVALFLKDAPEQLKAVQQGIAAGDAELVRRAAHTLKANGALFGATAFSELCRDLEAAAREGKLSTAPDLAARIEIEFARVTAALTTVNGER